MAGTLYDLLKIPSTSGLAEIEAAHGRLSQQLRQAGAYGLSGDEAQARLKQVDEAYRTLSDPMRRAQYDAALAVQAQAAEGAPRLLDPEKIRPVIRQAPRVLNIVNGSLKAVLLAVLIGFLLLILFRSSWHSNAQREAELAQAERIRAQERALDNGGKSAAEIEADKLEAERKREERARQDEERKQARQLEEDRRYAARVSEQLRRDEERIRREKESEARQREQEERRLRQEEEYRVAQQNQRWRQILAR